MDGVKVALYQDVAEGLREKQLHERRGLAGLAEEEAARGREV